MANYKFACTTCSQRIAYDENAFGRKIRCPNCKSIITIPVPEGAAPAGAAPAPTSAAPAPPPPPGVKPAGPVAARPIPGTPAAAAAARAGEWESKSQLVVMIVVVLLIVGGGVAAILMGKGAGKDAVSELAAGDGETLEDGEMSEGDEPEMSEDMADAMPAAAAFGEMKPEAGGEAASGEAVAWAPKDAQFFLSLRPAQLLESPLIEGLLAEQPQAMQQLAAVEQMAGFKVADIDSMLVAVSGLDELLADNLAGIKPGSPQAQMALLQAGQKMNDKQVVILKFGKPVDFGANPMLNAHPEAEFNGATYRKVQMQPGAPAVAVYSPDSRTLIIGAEKHVQGAIAGGGKGAAATTEFAQLREDHHLALVFSPSDGMLDKMREAGTPEEMKGDPTAELLAKHVSGGSLALTSESKGIAIQAVLSGDDAEAASSIVAALKERLAEVPKQLEMMQSAIPANLRGAAKDLAASLSAEAAGTAVEFSAGIPNELLSQEGMNALMGFAMAQAMQAGAAQSPAAPPAATPAATPAVTAAAAPAATPGDSEASPTMKKEESEAPKAVAMAEPATPEDGAPTPVIAAKEGGAEAAPVEEAAEPMPEKPSRMLTAWTMNIPNAGIPDEPVTGMVNNIEFKLDSAVIENGVLILRKGSSKHPVLVVEVHNIQQPGEALDGKKFELPNVSGFNTPKVVMKWEDAAKLRMPMRLFDNSFAIKLEFGKMVDGKIHGKVFISVPDGRKSFVTGAFDAEVF